VTTDESRQPTRQTAVRGNSLAPYLPRLTIDWARRTPDDRYRVSEGTVAFVDISGFTKLSEGLARHGKVGAEELTATIGECFVALLDLAVATGGTLLKFGGDALLLYFSGEAHEARACRAAIDMRRELRTVGRLTVLGHKVSLRMSVGVHSGLFNFFLVGDSHRELIVTGPAASTTVSMEGAADAGEIVISPATSRSLRAGLVGAAKGPGHLLLRAPTVPEDAFLPFEPFSEDLDLSSVIPVGLRDALANASDDSEHRRVSLAFIHFDGTDKLIEEEGPAETADRLESLVTNVQRAVDRQQVTFLATDIDRDGGKIILAAGAPSTIGDDENRILLAVREIMDSDFSLPIRIGVNRGAVFVGEIGPLYRRTFTAMGDAVNLTARLMAKAEPGQILTTPDVLSRARTGFETVELEPFYVKGKAKPVRAMSVGAKTGEQRLTVAAELPLVGRVREMRLIERLAQAAAGGQGTLVEIVGEPGAGKSRLIEWLRQATADRVQLTAECERYDSSTPYHVVRRLLRSLLELPAEGTSGAVTSLFLGKLAHAPEALPWAPLIGAAIGLPVPETPETRDLDEEFRRSRLALAVIELLSRLLPESGLLFVEDAQFMDEASADLFGHLAKSLDSTSWLICVTRRDVEMGFVAPPSESTSVVLLPLAESETTELAQMITRDAPLPPHELGVLVERSGGNPLFLRELIAAAMDGDAVDQLPDSVEDVIAARIDRLASDDRFLLRRMSVLGQSFSFDLLLEVIDEVPEVLDPTWERLEEFVAQDGLGNLSFRSALLRDCAYDGLSYRRRRELHARAGDTIHRAANKEKDQPELLSFHYLHAQRYEEAWRYSLVAAERAKTVYANIEAAEFYERALVAGRRLPHITRVELSAIHEALGDARNRTGGYIGAAKDYRAARRLVDDDVVAEARLILKLARVQGWLDRYGNALRWISKGLRLVQNADGDDAARQRAELLGWYGRFCQEQGHHTRAIKWCTLAIEQAEAVDDKEVLADALRVVDWAKMDLGQLEEPDNWERALDLFEELDDLPGQAGVLNMLGGFAYFRGEWGEALELYRRAQSTVRRTGNAVMDAFYVFNIGEIALDQGHLETAEQHFETVSRTWRAAGYRSGAAFVKFNLARVASGQGRCDEALRLFEESVQESRDIGSHGEALDAQARMAECLLLSGKPAEALSTADDALARAQSLGGVASQLPLLQRIRGVALAHLGNARAAMDALEQSLRAARTRRAEFEIALTLRAMAEYGVESDDDVRDEQRQTAAATLAKLGVVWTPDLAAVSPLGTTDTARETGTVSSPH
jgi:class 3 adenylate cyclase/tetratricopeptide (TPR) repeat protein